MLNYNQEQHSIDWYRSRLGFITGSRVGLLMKSGRSKSDEFSATAKSYLFQLAGERGLNREIIDDDQMLQYYIDQTSSQSKAMRFGTEQEPNAREAYSEMTGNEVAEVGLCAHPVVKNLASSPDGVFDEKGVLGCIEIKCPSLSTYVQYAAEIHNNKTLKSVNPDYYYQCQCHMACTEAQFCDFVAYCPFVENPIHIVRIWRDDKDISELLERVGRAETYINNYFNQLKTA